MSLSHLIAIAVILAGVIVSIQKKKLTVIASVTGGLIAILILMGSGISGVLLLAAFFILGTGATAWKMNFKIQTGIAEPARGRRNVGQVLANGGVATILSILMLYQPESGELYCLMIAGSFSAATADTLSSELGNIYGRNYYHILSFKKMQRGANGAVSWQGTLAGLLGSTFISMLFLLLEGWSFPLFLIIILSGTIGNLADSLLGLTLENKGQLTNNGVNFLNTIMGAVTAWGLFALLSFSE